MGRLSGQAIIEVIVALPRPSLPELLNLVGGCREHGIGVSFVPQPCDLYLSKPALLDLDGIPVLELHEPPASDFFFLSKRLVDIVLGSLFSAIAIPVLLPAVIGLRRTKVRVFRWETRCGRSGKSFFLLSLT